MSKASTDAYEEQSRETIDTFDLTPRGGSGTSDFLRDTPYDMQKWVRTIRETIAEEVDLTTFDDDAVIAHAQVDLVSRIHPATQEFDICYEGRWTPSEAVEEAF